MRPVPGVPLAVCCALLAASGCKREDPARPAGGAAPVASVSAKAEVLAELPEGTAAGDGPELVFAERGGGVAWVASDGGGSRVVHGGRAGKAYAEVGRVVLSPDGRRWAHAARGDGGWRMVVDGKEGAVFAELEAPAFSPDGAHLAYLARDSAGWHLVVDGKAIAATRTRYLEHGFAGDSARLVFVDEADERGRGRLVVADLRSARQTAVDAGVSLVIFNAERTRIAAIAARDGKHHVLTLALDAPGEVRRGPAFDAVHKLAFGPDGASLAVLAERAGELVAVLGEREQPLEAGADMVTVPVVLPGGAGVGAAFVSDGAVLVRHLFTDAAPPEGRYQSIEELVYASDGRSHAYAAEKDGRWRLVANGKEGPAFDRVVSPAFSPDGRRLVYRARQDGRRFVVVADAADGRTIRQHPAYDQVFPVRFTADGKSIAYGVKDGRKLAWKVEPL